MSNVDVKIVALGHPEAADASLYGAKAARLSRLAVRGFAVPPGVCIPAALLRAGVASDILRAALAPLRGPVAVRSSALVEDASAASFAGQFETFLDVPLDGAPDAVLKCAAGARRASVRAYAASRGIAESALDVSVLVQEMVAADLSGVLFTANPVTQNLRQMVVNSAPGRGDALVAGAVPAATVTLDRDRANPDPLLEELRRIGLAIEREMGQPADIEWARSGGRLFVLQARPITSIVRLPPRPVPYARTYAWTHANFAETMPRPVTPLGWSLMEFAATEAMIRPFRPLNRVRYELFEFLFGRVYWNITAFYSSRWLLKAFSESIDLVAPSIRADIERLADAVRPAPLFTTGQKLLLAAQAALFVPPIALSVLAALLRPRAIRRGLDAYEASLRAGAPRPGGGWRDEARRLGDYFYRACRDMHRRYLPSFFASVLLVDAFLRAARRLLRIAPLEAIEMIVPDEPTLTAQADLALWNLAQRPASDAELARYLERFGHRGPGEQDIVHPRHAEDPQIMRELLRASARAPSPAEAAARRRARADASFEERLKRAGPFARPFLRLLLRMARAFYPFRENGKHYLMLAFHLVKPALLRVGRLMHAEGLLDAPDDVYFLTIREILGAKDGIARATLAARKEDFVRYRDVRAPLVITSDGIPAADAPAAADGVLRGDGVSAGVATGRVRIVHDPALDRGPEPGEVLVAPCTDPGWTPLFLNAAALVTEVGGMLSHGAVVARELGVPAVVNVRDATRLLRDGQTVTVDGARGEIR